MITKINLKKANGYLNLAKSGNYVIWGTDGFKGYTHKLYLVIYREDYGKTIEKTLGRFGDSVYKIKLHYNDFNELVETDNSKIIGIKNKGLSEQIINLLRGEDG